MLAVTDHYSLRAAQRGFTLQEVDLILEQGDLYDAGKGVYAYWITKSVFSQLVKKKIVLASNSKLKDSVVLMDPVENVLITVMHCNKKPRGWKQL